MKKIPIREGWGTQIVKTVVGYSGRFVNQRAL